MGNTLLEKQIETYKNKIQIMEHALSASAGAYYNINITKNIVPGTMYQVIDEVEYSINEAIGFPDDCRYWDVVEYWGKQLTKDQQPAYFAFFDIDHLKACYDKGETHVFYRYRTKDFLGKPMVAEQHVVMYSDMVNGDLLAITYVLDLTKIEELHIKEMEHRKILEDDIKKIEGLAGQYSALYLINFDTNECTKYSLSKELSNRNMDVHDLNSYLNMYKDLILTYTHPDYRDELAKFADEDYIKEVLRNKKRHACRFLHMGKNGEYLWLELTLIKFTKVEEEASYIAFAFLNVDEEEREKENQRKMLVDALAAAEPIKPRLHF